MKTLKLIMMLGLGAMVSACATTDTATRNARFDPVPPQTQRLAQLPATPFLAAAPTNMSAAFNVSQINILVPRDLKVSERNSYYPGGDIVWREDPIGDRHAQVKAIFDAGLTKGTSAMVGDADIRLDVKVMRFHALTEKARYTTGGVHSITFALWVRDAKTGQPLTEPRIVEADLDAFGGQQAINAEARGQTQKVRITDHLAEVIRQELSSDEGFVNPKLGFLQALNNI